MYNTGILRNLALEHHRDILREAEQEPWLRQAKTNNALHYHMIARGIISLGMRLLAWSTSSERNPGASIKIDLMP